MTLHDAITDVAGIKVGHWTDLEAATGCTVVLCEAGAVGGVDVRGGAPGTRGTDMLRPGMLVEAVQAVLLAGGSAYGLGADAGVMRWCEERGIGLDFGGQRVPIVCGANLFDLGTGRADVRPGAAEGYIAAASATDGPVAEGNVGAGTGATVAKMLGRDRGLKGGLGTASEALADGTVVGALVAVNASGEVFDSATGAVVAGPRGEPGRFLDTMAGLREARFAPPPPQNTTLAVVATNRALTKAQANRLSSVAHDGLARAIRPAHALVDGDVVFTLATGALPAPELRPLLVLEAYAARVVERAVLKAVRAAESLAGVPSVREWLAR